MMTSAADNIIRKRPRRRQGSIFKIKDCCAQVSLSGSLEAPSPALQGRKASVSHPYQPWRRADAEALAGAPLVHLKNAFAYCAGEVAVFDASALGLVQPTGLSREPW